MVYRLVSLVVGYPAVGDVDRDALDADIEAAARLAYGQYYIGLLVDDGLFHNRVALSEDGGDFELYDFSAGYGVRKELDRLVGGVDGFVAERVEARDQYAHAAVLLLSCTKLRRGGGAAHEASLVSNPVSADCLWSGYLAISM